MDHSPVTGFTEADADWMQRLDCNAIRVIVTEGVPQADVEALVDCFENLYEKRKRRMLRLVSRVAQIRTHAHSERSGYERGCLETRGEVWKEAREYYRGMLVFVGLFCAVFWKLVYWAAVWVWGM